MGHRLNRTVKNWRWWIALPVMAPFHVMDLMVFTGEIVLDALEVVVDGFLAISRWVEDGEHK